MNWRPNKEGRNTQNYQPDVPILVELPTHKAVYSKIPYMKPARAVIWKPFYYAIQLLSPTWISDGFWFNWLSFCWIYCPTWSSRKLLTGYPYSHLLNIVVMSNRWFIHILHPPVFNIFNYALAMFIYELDKIETNILLPLIATFFMNLYVLSMDRHLLLLHRSPRGYFSHWP